MSSNRAGGERTLVVLGFALLLGVQTLLGLSGVADAWTRGHNGWNGAAYQNGARNSLRWGTLFPLQYETANVPPNADQLYTHAPLALHLHCVASLWLFGDREASIRGVAAFWSVAAWVMLFAVVRRLWNGWTALLTAAIYAALPINAIYTNMANHSAGFVFWGLLAVDFYLRACEQSRRSELHYVGFLGALTMAATWDWPAYYVAGCIVAHSLATRSLSPARIAGIVGWVLVVFGGHLLLVESFAGGIDELAGTFNARRALSWKRFRTHLLVVPELMFTWPMLALSAGWLAAYGARLARGTGRRRDVLPISFLVAGLVHYLTFRWSAVIHSYWAWPLLPFVAIATATSVIAIVRVVSLWLLAVLERWLPAARARSVARSAGWVLGFVLLAPLATRDVQIVPSGRYAGGSMWFFTHARGEKEPYDSGRRELRLARYIAARTARDTGVQLHPSLKARRLEPRFDITLDRPTFRWTPRPRPTLDDGQGANGWVFVAPVDALAPADRIALARRHRYRELDGDAVVDLRSPGPDVEIWKSEPAESTFSWWLFHSPFERPVTRVRATAEESKLLAQIAEPMVDRP